MVCVKGMYEKNTESIIPIHIKESLEEDIELGMGFLPLLDKYRNSVEVPIEILADILQYKMRDSVMKPPSTFKIEEGARCIRGDLKEGDLVKVMRIDFGVAKVLSDCNKVGIISTEYLRKVRKG